MPWGTGSSDLLDREREQGLARARALDQPGRDVDRVADQRVARPLGGADVADDHVARIDADADPGVDAEARTSSRQRACRNRRSCRAPRRPRGRWRRRRAAAARSRPSGRRPPCGRPCRRARAVTADSIEKYSLRSGTTSDGRQPFGDRGESAHVGKQHRARDARLADALARAGRAAAGAELVQLDQVAGRVGQEEPARFRAEPAVDDAIAAPPAGRVPPGPRRSRRPRRPGEAT